MPWRSRSHARRTTTGVLALLTRSNEGIFTVLDTLCLLWCVSRGTLSSRNCRHIRGSLSRHTLAPFPLRSRQVSTYHWPWRWYYCGVHCGRRPRASFPFWTHGLYHTFPGLGRGHVQRCLLMNLSFRERLRLVHGRIAGCVAYILDKDTTGLQPYHSVQWARTGSSLVPPFMDIGDIAFSEEHTISTRMPTRTGHGRVHVYASLGSCQVPTYHCLGLGIEYLGGPTYVHPFLVDQPHPLSSVVGALPHPSRSWSWARRSCGGACNDGDAGASSGSTTGGARHRGGGHGPLRAC